MRTFSVHMHGPRKYTIIARILRRVLIFFLPFSFFKFIKQHDVRECSRRVAKNKNRNKVDMLAQ